MSLSQFYREKDSKHNNTETKHLVLWFHSLEKQQKSRLTKIVSSKFTNLICESLNKIELQSKMLNESQITKKTKQNKESTKTTDFGAWQNLLNNLFICSENGFLDTISLDYQIIQDTEYMMEIITTLFEKASTFQFIKKVKTQQFFSKQEILIMLAYRIRQQIEMAMQEEYFPTDYSSKRKHIGNFWSSLDSKQKVNILNYCCQDSFQCVNLSTKTEITVSKEILLKQINKLLYLGKRQFCKRLLKCRIKNALFDPIKAYHNKIYDRIVQNIKVMKNKKVKNESNYEQTSKFEAYEKFQQRLSSIQNIQSLQQSQNEQIFFETENSFYLENSSKVETCKEQTKTKAFSVVSKETNETKQQEDFRICNYAYESNKVEEFLKHKITKDLKQFAQSLFQKASFYNKYRKVAYNRIQYLLSCWQVPVSLFGSCANGLMIDKSDLDIAVSNQMLNFYPSGTIKERVKAALTYLHYVLNNQTWVASNKLYADAAIPLIKLEVCTATPIENPFNYDDEQCNFKGFPEDNIKIQIDISIDTSQLGEQNHSGLEATNLMRKWIAEIPNVYHIYIYMKHFFKKNQFNVPYKGGIGSFCLMVMIVFYLKHHKKQNEDICSQFESILNFYAHQFNQGTQKIGQSNVEGNYISKKQIFEDKLQVRDPLNNKIMTKHPYLFFKIREEMAHLRTKTVHQTKNQIIEHIGMIGSRIQKQSVLNMSPEQYFNNHESLFSNNIFSELEFN